MKEEYEKWELDQFFEEPTEPEIFDISDWL